MLYEPVQNHSSLKGNGTKEGERNHGRIRCAQSAGGRLSEQGLTGDGVHVDQITRVGTPGGESTWRRETGEGHQGKEEQEN